MDCAAEMGSSKEWLPRSIATLAQQIRMLRSEWCAPFIHQLATNAHRLSCQVGASVKVREYCLQVLVDATIDTACLNAPSTRNAISTLSDALEISKFFNDELLARIYQTRIAMARLRCDPSAEHVAAAEPCLSWDLPIVLEYELKFEIYLVKLLLPQIPSDDGLGERDEMAALDEEEDTRPPVSEDILAVLNCMRRDAAVEVSLPCMSHASHLRSVDAALLFTCCILRLESVCALSKVQVTMLRLEAEALLTAARWDTANVMRLLIGERGIRLSHAALFILHGKARSSFASGCVPWPFADDIK